jgi:ADP-ribosyl-[dinitrogen reductase] hydrolase
MQTVLHFLFATSSFEECLIATVNQGGDADTTGAIVGAIAGAYYGLESIPREWLRKLDPAVRTELQLLADQLIDRSPLAQGRPISIVGQGEN